MKESLLVKIKSSDLLKNGSLSMVGTILIRAVDLISIPIFTRILDTATYGRVSIFTTYTQILMVLLGLDINGCVGRATIEYKEKRHEFYSVTMFFTMVWTMIVIFLFNTFHGLTENLLSMNQLEMNIMLVYSFAYFTVLYKSGEYIYSLKYKENIVMSMLIAFGNLGLSVILVLGVFSGNRFLGNILGVAIPTIIISITVLIGYYSKCKRLFNKEYIVYALKFGVPLIPHNLSHLILSSSDRVMIQSMVSDTASGIYALAHNVGVMMQVFTEGANNAWTPMLFIRLEANEKSLIKRQARIYLVGYTMLATAIIAASPEVLKIFGGKDFWAGIDFVMYLCLATYYIFVYQLYVNIEFYHKKTGLISLGTIMSAVVNIILNLYGIPKYGYEFAAISTVISYACLILFHCFIVNYVIKERVLDNIFTILVAVCMAPVTYSIYLCRHSMGMRILLAIFYEIILIGVIYWLMNRTSDKSR